MPLGAGASAPAAEALTGLLAGYVDLEQTTRLTAGRSTSSAARELAERVAEAWPTAARASLPDGPVPPRAVPCGRECRVRAT
jgi:hypothetical protein